MNRQGDKRGRPAGLLTRNRQAILLELALAAENGERVGLAELSRRCGLYSYREARRTLDDIRKYGLEAVK